MNRIEFYSKLDKYKADKVNEEKEQNGGSLSHYGIPKMKWGHRRWQNPDGTFNEEGKIRYFGKNGTTKKNKEEKPASKNGKDQKIGGWYMNSIENAYMTPKTASERAVAELRVDDRIKNETIDSFENSKKNRLVKIMDGDYFDRLNRMQSALSKGKTEKYNKLLNKFKEEDRELVEDYVKKLNDNVNDHRDSYLYDFNNNKEKFYAEIKARENKAAEDKINQERARENSQDYPKRYNANGEELAHPWDPYDDLTVNQLNEIRQKYSSEPDQKIGKMTYGFDKNGKFFQINDKYQNPDGTLTKKGLKMLKKGKNIEDFADAELYEKSTMTPEEVTAYDEKKYWDPAKEISNNVQTTKELKGKDISDEEFNKILNDSISMYELRQDRSKRQEYNDVGDITLLAMRKAGWLDNDTAPGDDDSRFWALNEDQTIGFGALADLYYKGYSKDYIKKFIDKTESMSGEDFDKYPGAWEINYATYGDQGKKFVDALFSKEDNLDIDRFGNGEKIGSTNSKEDAKANKEAVKLLADLNDKNGTKRYETLQKLYNDPRFEEQRNNVDKAIKEKFKDDFDELEKTYGGFDEVENEYLALAGLNRALMEDGGKMEDISYMPRLYLYDDLNQGSLTGESIWAYDNGIEDSSERWSKIYNKENSTKDELVNSLTSDGSYNSKVLNGLDDGTKKDIVDHVYNYKSVPSSYWTLYNAGDTSKSEYDSVKDTTLKEAREISKKLSSSCGSDASGWALLNKAVNNLNLGGKDYTELTQADWDRINAEINSLKR